MSWVRSPLARYLLLIAVAALGYWVAMWAIRLNGYRLTPAGVAAVALAWTVVASGIVWRYWRRIDEAAREAQKWAWLWGGAYGMGAAAVVMVLNPFGLVDAIIPSGADRRHLMTYGAGFVIAGQAIGFHVAWAWWWWSRR